MASQHSGMKAITSLTWAILFTLPMAFAPNRLSGQQDCSPRH